MNFIKGMAHDERIPVRDKKIFLAILVLIVSPMDLVPDWNRNLGLIDDLFYLAIVMDYLFRLLDSRIVLSHYPWSMKSFAKFRKVARFLEFLVPKWLGRVLWKYEPEPF